jgi:hypothetical protein
VESHLQASYTYLSQGFISDLSAGATKGLGRFFCELAEERKGAAGS